MLGYLQAAILNCVSGPFLHERRNLQQTICGEPVKYRDSWGFTTPPWNPLLANTRRARLDCTYSTYKSCCNVHLNSQRVIRLFFRTLWKVFWAKALLSPNLSLVAQFPTNGFSIFLDTKLVLWPQGFVTGTLFHARKYRRKKSTFGASVRCDTVFNECFFTLHSRA